MFSQHVCLKAVCATGALLAVTLSPTVVSFAAGVDNPVASGAADPSVRAYCGIGVAPLSPTLTAQLPEVTGQGRGVLVATVMQNSPAEKAGLKIHDILIQYDNQNVYSPEQLVKLVHHDKPGREVVVTYVRAGKVLETKMTLSQAAAAKGVGGRAAGPASRDEGRASIGRERARQNDPAPWARFESLTVSRLEDGRLKAQIDFRDQDKKIVHREYVGTREEIRKALEQDKELPADEREHLLRTIDQQQPHLFQFVLPRSLRDWLDPELQFFNWPNADF
jgi:serine protease Do